MSDTPVWITAVCDADYMSRNNHKPYWRKRTLEEAISDYEKEKATAPTVTQ